MRLELGLGFRGRWRFNLVFHAVAGAFDDDGFSVVEEAIQHGGSDGAVVVEDGGPLLEGFIGGQDERAAFVALADDLKEQVGSVLVNGQIAHFVQDEQLGERYFRSWFLSMLLFWAAERSLTTLMALAKSTECPSMQAA